MEKAPAEIKDEWIVLDENDPPPDLSREDAAFERERARLVREGHVGKIVLVRGDEVIGPFGTLFEAETEGYRRFGINARMIFCLITENDEPEWIGNADINHPSVRRID